MISIIIILSAFSADGELLELPLLYSSAVSNLIPLPPRTVSDLDGTIDALYEHVNDNFDSIRANLRTAAGRDDLTFLSISESEEDESESSKDANSSESEHDNKF